MHIAYASPLVLLRNISPTSLDGCVSLGDILIRADRGRTRAPVPKTCCGITHRISSVVESFLSYTYTISSVIYRVSSVVFPFGGAWTPRQPGEPSSSGLPTRY
jgi:hypothetical protein